MRVPKAKQLELYRRYARRGHYAAMAHRVANIDRIIDLGERRAFGSEGIDIYGDATWLLDRPGKMYEAQCEAADEGFYWATILAADEGAF